MRRQAGKLYQAMGILPMKVLRAEPFFALGEYTPSWKPASDEEKEEQNLQREVTEVGT